MSARRSVVPGLKEPCMLQHAFTLTSAGIRPLVKLSLRAQLDPLPLSYRGAASQRLAHPATDTLFLPPPAKSWSSPISASILGDYPDSVLARYGRRLVR